MCGESILTIDDSKAAAFLAQRAINYVPYLLVGDQAVEVGGVYISVNDPAAKGLFSGLRGSHEIRGSLDRTLRDGRRAGSSDCDCGPSNGCACLRGGTSN